MKCLKNPNRDPRLLNAANCYEKACDINIVLIANLLDTLHELYPGAFGRTGMERFLLKFIDNVHWLEADDDSELREYRLKSIYTGIPYITARIAEEIVLKVSSQSNAKAREVLKSPEFKSGLIENTVLMLATLHDDYGFARKRISDVAARWKEGYIADGEKWLKEHIDFHTDRESDRRDIIKKLLKSKKKKPRTTLREQMDARRDLEALKAYQEDMGVKA